MAKAKTTKTAAEPKPAGESKPAAPGPKGSVKVLGTYGTMYYVKDMKKAVDYFTQTLGAKPSTQSADWTEFSFGGHALCLHAYKEDKSPVANGTLILHVEDINASVEALKSRMARVEGPREVHPGAWSADLIDPEGNRFSLYQGPKAA